MRALALAAGILVYSGLAYGQANIRQVDFKNFSYPLSGPLLGHGELKWLGLAKDGDSKRKPINLLHGTDGKGFTLQSVTFADVAGDGLEDAIVVLLYETGGTQYTHYVYIYSFVEGEPKLLAYCHTGDRADFGLYKVYGKKGELAFELLDPRKKEGDCCSTGFVREQYKWDGKQFVRTGNLEFGPIKLIVMPDK